MNTEIGFSYKSIFEETVDAIIITDGSSEKIIDINRAGCELIGCKKSEILGAYIYDFLVGGKGSESPKNIYDIKMYGSVLSNKKIKTKSGSLIPVDLTINTFGDTSGNYVMTTLRNVSERIAYEEKILLMNEELSQSNASKDKFFSIIAHDLKNPISALIWFSEMITSDSEDITPEETEQFLGMIKNLSNSTYELLENLLNWARIQTKNIEIDKNFFDLRSLVDKTLDVLKPSAEMKSVKMINEVPRDFLVYADENMITTIIRNFVSNSIKFSPKNTRVTIKAGEDNKQWNIEVVDEGLGMDESYVSDLFKIDVHTSRNGTNNEKGTGLGLILCNEFAKLHGSEIEVHSELNKGSEFIIHLPKVK